MAVSYVARKCTQCAGKLEYNKEKKIWKCIYCGAEIEREEQYDGLFTIKNVVRQALLDTAYRRLDSASKNVVECEKIDSRYVGTLIAKIAHEMITLITPDACSDRDAKNLFAQLKRNYELLRDQNPVISDDEEALYDFLEESDAYAILILVFDSLNDKARRDYVASLLDAKQVYSKAANSNLLSYAIKNDHRDMIDDIISNADNLDVKTALSEILAKYPDGEKKSQNIARLFDTDELKNEDKPIIEKYLSSSEDAKATKASVAVTALEHGMKIGLETIIDGVLKNADKEQVSAVAAAVCKNKLSDEDVLRLVDFGFSSDSADIAVSVLDCIQQSGQFLLMPAKYLISLLNSEAYSSAEKVKILNKCFEFKTDNKAFESVVTNYLCYNTSSPQDRKPILVCLFERVSAFPTNTVEMYVLKTNTDGDEKPGVISAIFDKVLHVSYFNDLLSKYMNTGIDATATKANIVRILSDRGLKVDPNSLIEYICESSDALPEKMKFVSQMIRNGSQLRGDAANTYLERTPPSAFSPELFAMIFSPGSTFTAKGIEKYVLAMKDRGENKPDNLKTIIEHSGVLVGALKIQITHLGNPIECNLLQAYLLTTTEPFELAAKIVDYFANQVKMKINAEMSVSGSPVKLKKYVVANKERLSPVTAALCEKFKVYSMLF